MADAKIINYGQQISAGSTAIPDNTTVALDIESTDAKDYITANTTDGSESITLGQQTKIIGPGGTTGMAAPTGADAPTLYLESAEANSQDECTLIMNADGNDGSIIRMFQDDTEKLRFTGNSNQYMMWSNALKFQNLSGSVFGAWNSNGNLGIGTQTAVHKFHVQDADIGIVTNNASDATAKSLKFTRSRNDTDGNATIVENDDVLGRIDWYGADASSGTTADNQTICASIYCQVDGAPGHEDMPGSIRFATTTDNAATLSDRVVLRQNGNVGLGDTEPNFRVVVGGSLSTPIQYSYNSNTSAMSNAITSSPNGAAGLLLDHRTGDSLYCINTTAENTAGGRETGIAFFGRADLATDEYPMQGAIRVQHEGTAADQKGYMTFLVNDGTDDRVPTECMRIESNGDVKFGTDNYYPRIQGSGGGAGAGNVSYSFISDTDTGLTSGGSSNTCGIATAGAYRMFFLANGNVGVSTTAAGQIFDVNQGSGNMIADGYDTHSLAAYKEDLETANSGYLEKVTACPPKQWKGVPFVSADEIKTATIENFGQDAWDEQFPTHRAHRGKALFNMPDGEMKSWIDAWSDARREERKQDEKWQQVRIGLVADGADTAENLSEVISKNDVGEVSGINTMSYIGTLHAALVELSAKVTALEEAQGN